MKLWQTAIGCVVVALAAGLGGWVLNDARHISQRSNVVFPTRAALRDIDDTAHRGRMELAKRKLHRLRVRWDEYAKGGKPPIQFYSEITHLSETSP